MISPLLKRQLLANQGNKMMNRGSSIRSASTLSSYLPNMTGVSSSTTLGELSSRLYTNYRYRLVWPIGAWIGFLYLTLWEEYVCIFLYCAFAMLYRRFILWWSHLDWPVFWYYCRDLLEIFYVCYFCSCLLCLLCLLYLCHERPWAAEYLDGAAADRCTYRSLFIHLLFTLHAFILYSDMY